MSFFSKIRYVLVYNRKDQLNSYGQALIQIRAYQDKKLRYFSTGIYIEPNYWDRRNKKIKHTHPNQFVYNQRIWQQMQEMEAFEIKMINRHGSFSIDRIHEYNNADLHEYTPTSFTQFFEEELALQEMKPSSRKMYQQTLNKLIAFKGKVFFEELNFQLIQGFDRFLRKQKLDTNTIKKHHSRLRTFILHATRKDLIQIDDNPYKKFKPTSKEPDRVFISQEELERIEMLSFSPEEEHFQQIKDIFLLAAYTGLRFSDVSNLRFGHVGKTAKGLTVSIKAKKTGKPLILPLYMLFKQGIDLPSKPEAIFNRYLEQFKPFLEVQGVDELPFFKITNQYFNRSLKLIAERVGIKKRLTSHVARRTFATIMATKVKAPVLQRLLQHSRPDMTNIYIQLSNHLVEEELQKVRWYE